MTQQLMLPGAGGPDQPPHHSAAPLDQIAEADPLARLGATYSHRADYTGEGWVHYGHCPTAREAHHD
jgi:hypothetical protein